MFIFSAMISAAEIKFVKSLQERKSRHEHRLFVVEGIKSVEELVKSNFDIRTIYTTNSELDLPASLKEKTLKISANDMERMSGLESPQSVMAVAHMPALIDLKVNCGVTLALDNIQDPGNLGSILRTADWFGVSTILCSENTVDVYNPKVVQSSMGSVFRVKTYYCNLKSELQAMLTQNFTLYATAIEGENVFKTDVKEPAVILFGNEGKGIGDELIDLAEFKISIPCFSTEINKPESLNVAASVAVILSSVKGKP